MHPFPLSLSQEDAGAVYEQRDGKPYLESAAHLVLPGREDLSAKGFGSC